jgi:hypothetical protein
MAKTNINVRNDTELNAETRAALAEYSDMRNNPGAYKRYDSFDELLSEVLEDDKD